MTPIEKDQRAKFSVHRADARRRGIEFLFTFEEWSAWWLEDGRWQRRGRGAGKLVMARYHDTGPYAVGNVYPATHAENMLDSAGPKRSAAIIKFHADRLARGVAPTLQVRGNGHPISQAVVTPHGTFESGRLAAEALGIGSSTLYGWIRKKRPGYRWAAQTDSGQEPEHG